jgi:hypothetical protein
VLGLAIRALLGAAMALALMGGCGAAASSASTHHAPSTGTVTGHVYILNAGARGVVDVLNARGRRVADEKVRWRHSDFRLVLKPGDYEFKLKMTPPSREGPDCPPETYRQRAAFELTARLTSRCDSTY